MEIDTSALQWEKVGNLIPAIVQDIQTGRVLMLGYMNEAALQKTLETGLVTFWSRSRSTLWTKGDTSGNRLLLEEIRPDCDSDSLLILARASGPTCHRETISCFGDDQHWVALEFLGELDRLISERSRHRPEGSYTTKLLNLGLDEICKKVGEEAIEVIVSAFQSEDRSVEESADLIYHLLVFLAFRGLSLNQIVEELVRRHCKS